MSSCELSFLDQTKVDDFPYQVAFKDNPIGNLISVDQNKDRSKPSVMGSFDISDFDSLERIGNLEDSDICKRKNKDISLIYWYHKLVNPPKAYKNFLDYLSKCSQKHYPALGQFTGFKAWEHENGCSIILPKIDTESYNPADKFQSIRSSASRTAKSLTNLKWLPSSNENKKCLVNLDLTFPMEISDKLLGGVGDLESRFWSVYKDFLDKLNRSKGSYDLANTSNLHLWSSKKPLNPHSHFHVSIIWAKKIENTIKPFEWYGKGKPVDIAKVKSLWAESVNEEFNTSYCSDKTAYEQGTTWLNSMLGYDPVVINSSWIPLSPKSIWLSDKENPESVIKKKVIHRLKYARRKPLTDLGEYFIENEFKESDLDIDYSLDLVEYRNSSRQFGFWTYLKKCVNMQESKGEEKQLCPVCGSEVSDVYSISLEEYQPDMLIKIGKRGSVYLGDPPPSENRRINSNNKPQNLGEIEDLAEGGDRFGG